MSDLNDLAALATQDQGIAEGAPAHVRADEAAALLDEAIARGDALDDAGRGRVAIEISSPLFELTGGTAGPFPTDLLHTTPA